MAVDPQSIVDAIDALLLAWAQGDFGKTWAHAGKTYTREDADHVLAIRKQYAGLAAATALDAGTLRPLKMYGVRFRKPS